MSSLMEKVTSDLELVNLSKRNFRKTLDSLQEGAHSVLRLSIQWKEIESFFDSSKNALEERAKELEALEESVKSKALELETKEKELGALHESMKDKALELEAKEKELGVLHESMKGKALELEVKEKELCCLIDESTKAKLSDLEKKEKELNLTLKEEEEKRKREVEQVENFTRRMELVERVCDEKLKVLDVRAKELELKVKEVQKQNEQVISRDKWRSEFEPLVSLLAKNMGSMPLSLDLSCNETDFVDKLVKKNLALARMVPYLDPAKVALDAIQECWNKGLGEAGDRVVNSCIFLLENLMRMNVRITPLVKQEATQLGFDWIRKVEAIQNDDPTVLGCLLFLSVYGLAPVTTPEVLLTLLERFLLYDHAPKLFRLLDLQDKVADVVETLKKKEEYLATLKFICEFRLYKLCPGGQPGELLHKFLVSSDKAAQVIAGRGSSKEAQQNAWREKRRDDAVMALKCIKEAKAESMFPNEVLKELNARKNNESAQRATKPVHNSYEKGKSATKVVEKSKTKSCSQNEQKREAKRQRLTEQTSPSQNITGKGLESVSIQESGVNHQPNTIATHASRTETKPNIVPGSINADVLRELIEKQPIKESKNISNALKSTPDPAKLFLDTSMTLCPTNSEGGYEFKLLITPASCSLLVNKLRKLQPQIGSPVKGDAKKLAKYWKDKISKSKRDELEVICFLQFLGIFGIVSEFKANDLLGLLDHSYWQSVSPDLCKFLGLDNDIPDFIQDLIKSGHHLKAINYIYSFNMVHRFQPVSIINDFLKTVKESSENSCRDAKNEPSTQVAAIGRQIKSLKLAIRCISSHKLESEFQLGNLEEQVSELVKRRRNTSKVSVPRSLSKPDTTLEQSQMEKPPSVAEVRSLPGSLSKHDATVEQSQSHTKKPPNVTEVVSVPVTLSKPDSTIQQSKRENPPNVAEVVSVSGSLSKPDMIVKQSHTEKPPNVSAEVVSVTTKTPLQPSTSNQAMPSSSIKPSKQAMHSPLEPSKHVMSSKPPQKPSKQAMSSSKPFKAKKTNRGKKRNWWRARENSGAVHSSNHFPRQTWLVNNYGMAPTEIPDYNVNNYGMAPTEIPDYNFNNWRQQLEQPPVYPHCQPYNPYFINQ